jgi:hypothetical protein
MSQKNSKDIIREANTCKGYIQYEEKPTKFTILKRKNFEKI